MSQPKRIWDDALRKVENEGMCRVCGRSGPLEAAHVSGRVFDKPKPGRKTRWVDPDDIVPLCAGNFTEHGLPKRGCHGLYDTHKLDLLSYLQTPEQVKAVANYESIESARRRLCPSAYRDLTCHG